MKSRTGHTIAALAVLAVASAGCSTKSDDTEEATNDGVTTGAGVKDGTISLGMMVDLSGPFAPIGTEMSHAAKVYWDAKNADGGVCGKFPVKLDIKDNAYNVQTTVSLYSDMKDDTLAFQSILGSAPALAIADSLADDDMLVALHGQGQEALGVDNIMLTGATFDIEAANGLGYLLEQGEIAEGDTIGHIYLEGAYGEGVLGGAEKFTDEHGMTLAPTQVTPTITDLTPAITDLRGKDVDAIIISGTPPQLASGVAAAEAANLDVPILGSTPTWTASLLDTPAAEALRENLYVAFPASPFENKAAAAFREQYIKAYPKEDPSLQIVLQYVEVLALDAVLEQACDDGDLTREGVMKAKSELTTLDTDGVSPTLDLSNPNRPATGEQFVTRAADVPGGLTLVEGPYISEFGQTLLDEK